MVENVIKCMRVSQTDCNRIEIYKDVQFEKHGNVQKPCCIINGDLCVTTIYETIEKRFKFLRVNN